ncbi:hypothetical protein WN943_006682 [Citrus x changshan-huyou]
MGPGELGSYIPASIQTLPGLRRRNGMRVWRERNKKEKMVSSGHQFEPGMDQSLVRSYWAVTFKLPLFPEAEILAEAKAVKLFAYSVSVKDTPLAVDAEVLNDFEGQYLSSSFFLDHWPDRTRREGIQYIKTGLDRKQDYRHTGLRDRPIDIRTKVTAYFLGMECLLLYGFIFFYGSLLL